MIVDTSNSLYNMKTKLFNKAISESSNLLNLTADLYPLLRMYDDGNELEIRFGYYDGEYFRSCLSSLSYNRLLKNFIDDENYVRSYISNNVHMYSNGIRQIHSYDNITNIKKIKKTRIDNHDLGLRIALSIEKELTKAPSGKYIKKSRLRHTFNHIHKHHKIDLTIDTFPKSKQYQCEVEFTAKPNITDIIDIINTIKGVIN